MSGVEASRRFPRALGAVLALGYVLAAVLLARLAYDLGRLDV